MFMTDEREDHTGGGRRTNNTNATQMAQLAASMALGNCFCVCFGFCLFLFSVLTVATVPLCAPFKAMHLCVIVPVLSIPHSSRDLCACSVVLIGASRSNETRIHTDTSSLYPYWYHYNYFGIIIITIMQSECNDTCALFAIVRSARDRTPVRSSGTAQVASDRRAIGRSE